MRRPALILTLALGLVLSGPTAHAKNPECRFGTGARAVVRTIWCGSHKLSVSGAFRRYALYVAYRESHYQASARNAYSGACGIFQHLPTYWPGRYSTFSLPRFGAMGSSCYNGRTNALVSLVMAKRVGWAAWS
jgi:hypothetical protein